MLIYFYFWWDRFNTMSEVRKKQLVVGGFFFLLRLCDYPLWIIFNYFLYQGIDDKLESLCSAGERQLKESPNKSLTLGRLPHPWAQATTSSVKRLAVEIVKPFQQKSAKSWGTPDSPDHHSVHSDSHSGSSNFPRAEWEEGSQVGRVQIPGW